ncbi:phosphatidate cytidylyltransferase [Malassezia caprae]|uniref:Phosphatidate cytidylyltransferase n=1 Tax=Malassezia caprae TaxID=1381934 RepID=A0AAF0E7S5_9BASI|nr:phosphatidate cytidylyltransferase [Malassezia caprae]
MTDEQRALLSPTRRAHAGRPRHWRRWARACSDTLGVWWPTISLLVLPHTLGLMQAVQVPAEVDAIRSLSCAHYYALHPAPPGTLSCLDPAVERHFSMITTQVTFSVVLANFFSMLVYGRLFQHHWRRWMAAAGLCGCAVARIPFLVLPMYQFPHLVPDEARAISPRAMLALYWGCAVLGGLSGANEIVTLSVESFMVDTTNPNERSSMFRLVQVAQLLGASAGPILGSLATQWMPFARNRCIGYRACQPASADTLLFNNAPYWLSLGFVLLGLLWALFAMDVRGAKPLDEQNGQENQRHVQPRAQPKLKYRWLGAFQRLVPVRTGHWTYDARIAELMMADMCVAFSIEGPVVLILVLGYVFHWNRDLLSIGLGVTNALKLITVAAALPLSLRAMARICARPHDIADLTDEQLHMCVDLNEEQLHPDGDTDERPRQAQALQHVSQDQRRMARLWRAQLDLDVSRVSFGINVLSWAIIAVSLERQSQALVIVGAILLTAGTGAQPLLRSAASTMADRIVEHQEQKAVSLSHAPEDQDPLPRGSDSYLVIVSTLLLPCLLMGLLIRNYIYTNTVAIHPASGPKNGLPDHRATNRFASLTGFDALKVEELPSEDEEEVSPTPQPAPVVSAPTRPTKKSNSKRSKASLKKASKEQVTAPLVPEAVPDAPSASKPVTPELGIEPAHADKAEVVSHAETSDAPPPTKKEPVNPEPTEEPTQQVAMDPPSEKQTEDASAKKAAFWKKVKERTVFSLLMIGGFSFILAMGPSYLILLVLILETLVYREITALFNIPGRTILTAPRSQGYADDEDHSLTQREADREELWSKTMSWYFFAVCNFFLYGESLTYYFKHIVLADSFFVQFARLHRFISFMLYIFGFMAFVSNLKRRNLKHQFALFCWVHMSLMLIVMSSHFIVDNILEGIVWFWVPSSLVICNDIFAYVCGMLWGRTPLISLSPKKTVEGFVGALAITMVFSWFWAGFFQQFKYMICPAVSLGMNVFHRPDCDVNPVFLMHRTALPAQLSELLSSVFRRSITHFSWTPFQCHALVMAAFASLVAPFGGFFASGFKRAFRIKDFGDSIPGHGGLTDRFDCQFLMGLFSYVYFSSLIRDSRVSVQMVMQMIITYLPLDDQKRVLHELTSYLVKEGQI